MAILSRPMMFSSPPVRVRALHRRHLASRSGCARARLCAELRNEPRDSSRHRRRRRDRRPSLRGRVASRSGDDRVTAPARIRGSSASPIPTIPPGSVITPGELEAIVALVESRTIARFSSTRRIASWPTAILSHGGDPVAPRARGLVDVEDVRPARPSGGMADVSRRRIDGDAPRREGADLHLRRRDRGRARCASARAALRH